MVSEDWKNKMILEERKITSRQATSSVLAEAEKVQCHLTIFY
jgi:hypothetical protein